MVIYSECKQTDRQKLDKFHLRCLNHLRYKYVTSVELSFLAIFNILLRFIDKVPK